MSSRLHSHAFAHASGVVRTTVALTLAFSSASMVWAQPAQCPAQPQNQPLPPPLRQTVVITDPAVMTKFGLDRTLDAIIESSPGHTAAPTAAERAALLQSLLATFKETKFVNTDSNVALTLNTRPAEAGLNPADLLLPTGDDGMRPVGLFNRLDLAPADLRNCGQHRIVYAKGPAAFKPINRFFLIFEAALDNPVDDPDMAKRAAGCREVALFWDGLKNKSGADLAAALEDFYFKGLKSTTPGGPTFKPVVQFAHFGTPDGQVRGNLFVNLPTLPLPFSWELREWRLVTSQNAQPSFAAVTVKDNPIAQLYGARKASDPFDSLQDPFKAIFVDANEPGETAGTFLQQLTAYDREVIKSGTVNGRKDELSATVAMKVQNKFNDFQSVEGVPGDSPDDVSKFAAQSDIAARIAAKLNDTAACNITSAHVINRAGANSCAGCHEFSKGRSIAPGVVWPDSAERGFVHIREDGKLSPALENEFLHARRRVLDRALVAAPAPVPTPAPVPVTPAPPVTYAQPLASVAAVRGSLQGLQGIGGGSRLDFLESAAKLERQVIQSRALERALPGAFVTIRREH